MENVSKLIGKSTFIRRLLAETTTNDFQFKVRQSISHQRIRRTKSGYLGLAPALTQIGDRVALLKDRERPLSFVRRREKGNL